MKDKINNIPSISFLHEMFGFDKPNHPLISIVDIAQWVIPPEMVGVKFTSDLYSIGMKDKSCGLQYGRHHYDFDEGVLIFTAPSQLVSADKEQKLGEIQGWMLFFHPDLIRNTNLGFTIDQNTYFSYDVHEALHLSDLEQKNLTECVFKIKEEINQRIDNHSQKVIVSSLELLLHYCSSYYERQFNTRSAENKDFVIHIQSLLKEYYDLGKFESNGIPSIQYFAEKVHLSQNYLSDLLRKETGKSAKEHINEFIIDKAKNLLLGSQDSVSEIAYTLGFNYPHYFSRIFRNKTGISPIEYRDVH